MKRAFAILRLFCGVAFAQSAATPTFTVADRRSGPHSSLPAMKGPFFGDNRYEIRCATILYINNPVIAMATPISPDSTPITGNIFFFEMK